jgi:hypothetical protein
MAVMYSRVNSAAQTGIAALVDLETALHDLAAQRDWEVLYISHEYGASGSNPQGGRLAWEQVAAGDGRLRLEISFVCDFNGAWRPDLWMVGRPGDVQKLRASLVSLRNRNEYSPAQLESLVSAVGDLLRKTGEAIRQERRPAREGDSANTGGEERG